MKLIHPWNRCNACKVSPISGRRYECQTCPLGPDADYCEPCYQRIVAGSLAHPTEQTPGIALGAHRFQCFEGMPAEETDVWFEVPVCLEVPAPVVPDGFVVRPEFCAGFETFFAGYSFIAATPKPVLLTAFHVMDDLLRAKRIDATDHNPYYRGDELPILLTKVNLYNVFAPNWMLGFLAEAGRMMVLPQARIRDPEPLADRDIAAFNVPHAPGLQPVPLASAVPAVGEPVWLAASHGGGDTQRTFPAMVVAVSDRTFIFRFLETKELPSYTSGAPILNSEGHVVAINVGGGKLKGHRFGHGNHVGNIRKHLGLS